ncbi:deaminase [Clostridium felsineum]|uniref:MafB19-like deaminase domain-containing protein n=1 Tax=Clostridium felsineum TaxID=36839 RepID=A0A9Q8UG71_9CLOT|nr:deaminase [Clostridium felsineum]URZ08857.1 hypothetical protein CLROS_042510 [Clostridium felsineum]URZ09485.1 hypothetical protein CROST_001560 [Clostridium felsineum]
MGAKYQFDVYDMGDTVHTLLTNPEAQAQFKAGVGHWWKQVCSGDAYTLGQTTATVLSVVVDPDDVGAAVSEASKAESLLGKMGTFSKSIAISSAENAKNIATLPWRTIDNLGSKVADLRTVLSKSKGVSVVVSSAKDAKNLLTKVKSTVSDVKTVSASFAKAFGKTYAKECRKYVNTCFSASGAVGAGAEAIYKASKDGFKEAKNALRTVKDEKNGFVDGVADTNAPWKAIDDYRNQRQGLEVLPEDYEFIKGDGKNTVAFNDTCDKRYFGVNSTLRTDAEKGLAKKYFNKLVEEGYFPKGSIYPRGKAQFITHAEGYTLIKAYEENGIDIGKSVTIYVDRPTCGFCQNNLPKLQASMGIDVLTVINKNGDVFRCDLRKYTSMTVSDVNAEKLIKIKSK